MDTANSFLDSSQNTELIRWSESGDSFIVLDEDEFARTLIPELFKHNNYASFVRQLNMYGFHKKVGLSDNSMRASERKNKTPSEYYNPFFKRGQPILLWIIQKPKNPHGKGLSKGGTKLKQEDGNLDDDGEETYSRQSPGPPNQGPVENMPSMRNHRQPLMIGNSAAGLPQQDLASVHQELQAVRQNQERITTMLNAVRRDHEHLYGQAAVFQSLHDRHESSINAILTFLATVYNRSLEGQGGQNFANMFAGTIPQDPQGQGNVVDVGEYGDQKMDMSNSQPQRPFRRQPLLLKGPPSIVSNGPIGRASTASPSTTSGTPVQRPQTRLSSTQAHRQPYAMEQSATNSVGRDHFVTTPSDHSAQSPQFKLDDTIDGQIPEADIMSMINSTNASITDFPGAQMDFPQALSHLQNADGKTPLTPNQRNDVLQLMANGSANTTQNGNNNALTSPDPPTMPDMANYNMTKEQIERLGHSIQDQGHTVNRLSTILAPLSPSGSIPGLTDAQGYNGPGGSDMLDLDQYFNSGDYFDDGGIAGDVNLGASADIPDFNFDTSPADEDGTSNGFPDVNGENALGGRIVEALDSSEATSPANTIEDDGADERQSPGKRRRRG